jgi:hypothetical protein
VTSVSMENDEDDAPTRKRRRITFESDQDSDPNANLSRPIAIYGAIDNDTLTHGIIAITDAIRAIIDAFEALSLPIATPRQQAVTLVNGDNSLTNEQKLKLMLVLRVEPDFADLLLNCPDPTLRQSLYDQMMERGE